MYHTASLYHDDVIDRADVRRGKSSLNRRDGQRAAVFAANYVVAVANVITARLRDNEVSRGIRLKSYFCELLF